MYYKTHTWVITMSGIHYHRVYALNMLWTIYAFCEKQGILREVALVI